MDLKVKYCKEDADDNVIPGLIVENDDPETNGRCDSPLAETRPNEVEYVTSSPDAAPNSLGDSDTNTASKYVNKLVSSQNSYSEDEEISWPSTCPARLNIPLPAMYGVTSTVPSENKDVAGCEEVSQKCFQDDKLCSSTAEFSVTNANPIEEKSIVPTATELEVQTKNETLNSIQAILDQHEDVNKHMLTYASNCNTEFHECNAEDGLDAELLSQEPKVHNTSLEQCQEDATVNEGNQISPDVQLSLNLPAPEIINEYLTSVRLPGNTVVQLELTKNINKERISEDIFSSSECTTEDSPSKNFDDGHEAAINQTIDGNERVQAHCGEISETSLPIMTDLDLDGMTFTQCIPLQQNTQDILDLVLHREEKNENDDNTDHCGLNLTEESHALTENLYDTSANESPVKLTHNAFENIDKSTHMHLIQNLRYADNNDYENCEISNAILPNDEGKVLSYNGEQISSHLMDFQEEINNATEKSIDSGNEYYATPDDESLFSSASSSSLDDSDADTLTQNSLSCTQNGANNSRSIEKEPSLSSFSTSPRTHGEVDESTKSSLQLYIENIIDRKITPRAEKQMNTSLLEPVLNDLNDVEPVRRVDREIQVHEYSLIRPTDSSTQTDFGGLLNMLHSCDCINYFSSERLPVSGGYLNVRKRHLQALNLEIPISRKIVKLKENEELEVMTDLNYDLASKKITAAAESHCKLSSDSSIKGVCKFIQDPEEQHIEQKPSSDQKVPDTYNDLTDENLEETSDLYGEQLKDVCQNKPEVFRRAFTWYNVPKIAKALVAPSGTQTSKESTAETPNDDEKVQRVPLRSLRVGLSKKFRPKPLHAREE